MDKQLLLQTLDDAQSLTEKLESVYKSCDAGEYPSQSMMLYGLVNQARGVFEVVTALVMEQNRVEYTSQGE